MKYKKKLENKHVIHDKIVYSVNMSFIISNLFSIGFVIFVHELGHLLAAKKARVGVRNLLSEWAQRLCRLKLVRHCTHYGYYLLVDL